MRARRRIRVRAIRGLVSGPARGPRPLVHVPFFCLVLFLKREKVRSSSNSCGLWGRSVFSLVTLIFGVCMTVGFLVGRRWAVGGQLRRPHRPSTVVPSCPHFLPQLTGRLYPSAVGGSPPGTSPPIGVWAQVWVACGQGADVCGCTGDSCAQVVGGNGITPGQLCGKWSCGQVGANAVFLLRG